MARQKLSISGGEHRSSALQTCVYYTRGDKSNKINERETFTLVLGCVTRESDGTAWNGVEFMISVPVMLIIHRNNHILLRSLKNCSHYTSRAAILISVGRDV